VTLNGRPVAEIVPLPRRTRSLPWKVFIDRSEHWRADPELTGELADLVPETTDDLSIQ
jgi:antitoxin (DNA-binding transcriptional repressor) of toxin-antitoxin stability system